MNSRDVESLAVKMRSAMQLTMEAYFEEINAAAIATRRAVKKARRKGIKKEDDTWTESYDVRVRHYGSSSGRNAEVTMVGCKRSYDITQVYDGNAWMPKNQRPPAKWNVRIDTQGEDSEYGDRHVEDFEALIQQSVVALLGHAYYHLDDE